jgi:hypothetical protein
LKHIDILNLEINKAYGPESFLDSNMKIIFQFVLAFVELRGRFLCERKIM